MTRHKSVKRKLKKKQAWPSWPSKLAWSSRLPKRYTVVNVQLRNSAAEYNMTLIPLMCLCDTKTSHMHLEAVACKPFRKGTAWQMHFSMPRLCVSCNLCLCAHVVDIHRMLASARKCWTVCGGGHTVSHNAYSPKDSFSKKSLTWCDDLPICTHLSVTTCWMTRGVNTQWLRVLTTWNAARHSMLFQTTERSKIHRYSVHAPMTPL